jgi:hypothetical protein
MNDQQITTKCSIQLYEEPLSDIVFQREHVVAMCYKVTWL